MELIVNRIITREDAMFQEILTQKLMDTVMLDVITQTKTQLSKECMNDITAQQKEQEAFNKNLGEKILLM